MLRSCGHPIDITGLPDEVRYPIGTAIFCQECLRVRHVSGYPLGTVVWVLMTGAREFWRREVVRTAFLAIEAKWDWREPGPLVFRLIHGACPPRPVTVPGLPRKMQASADWHAEWVARQLPRWEVVESVPGVSGFPADWDRHGKPAGHIRNAEMVQHLLAQEGPKEVVGFPLVATKQHPKGTTPGTKNCLTVAERAGLDWWVAPLDMDIEDRRQEVV